MGELERRLGKARGKSLLIRQVVAGRYNFESFEYCFSSLNTTMEGILQPGQSKVIFHLYVGIPFPLPYFTLKCLFQYIYTQLDIGWCSQLPKSFIAKQHRYIGSKHLKKTIALTKIFLINMTDLSLKVGNSKTPLLIILCLLSNLYPSSLSTFKHKSQS